MAANDELRNSLFSFKEAFKNYTDCYTIIGGTACFILMEDAAMGFRATKDIDMILVLEDRRKEFGEVFWNYIVSGGYTCEYRKGETHYYRFVNPKIGFPSQIELFSRRSDFKLDQRIIPVFIDEDVSSLSAIALDDDFYSFMMRGRKILDNMCVLEPEYLIPFKMYAWLNNKDDRESGRRLVNTKDIDKHKKDVFKLFSITNPRNHIEVNGTVKVAVERFLKEIVSDPYEPEDAYDKRGKAEIIALLRQMYL